MLEPFLFYTAALHCFEPNERSENGEFPARAVNKFFGATISYSHSARAFASRFKRKGVMEVMCGYLVIEVSRSS